MKRNVRQTKYDPVVDEVELIEANPQYAHVRLQDGRETTVSLKQLAPPGSLLSENCESVERNTSCQEPIARNIHEVVNCKEPAVYNEVNRGSVDVNRVAENSTNHQSIASPESRTTDREPLHRSGRIRKEPDRLDL